MINQGAIRMIQKWESRMSDGTSRLTDEQLDAIFDISQVADLGHDHVGVEDDSFSITHDGEWFVVPLHHAIQALREYEIRNGFNNANDQGWYSSRPKADNPAEAKELGLGIPFGSTFVLDRNVSISRTHINGTPIPLGANRYSIETDTFYFYNEVGHAYHARWSAKHNVWTSIEQDNADAQRTIDMDMENAIRINDVN